MIRPAVHGDLPRLYELLVELHAGSKFPAMDVDISETAAKRILMDGVMRNGRTNDGGTLFSVYEHEGSVEGFMLGVLQRVYHICNRLEAQDFWLYCTKKAPLRAHARLIDEYVAWALNNPKVAEISLSWTDAAGVDPEKIGRLYQSRGFTLSGEVWKRAGT